MYSTRDVAAALGVPRKVVDNLLSNKVMLFGPTGRRGVSRRISVERAAHLALALLLRRDLGMSVARAAALASDILRAGGDGIRIGALGTIRYDTARLESVVRGALADVIQDQAPVRRGRPRVMKRGASPFGDAPRL